MARLEFSLREISAPEFQPATVVDMIGSIDPDTLEIFESLMDRLVEEGKVRLAFDLSRLKYINSTGMGMMVQYVDTLMEEGGGLVLMNMQPKVLLVVEMLGLQELFQIVSGEAEALKALSGGEVAPASIEVRLDEDFKKKPAPARSASEEAAANLKSTIGCPNCRARLRAPTSGFYRCPRCRAALEVDAEGQVLAYPEAVGNITEMTIPTDDIYLASASQIVALAAETTGLAEAEADAIAAATEGCLQLLAREAINGASATTRLHLLVRPENKKLTVRIYCGGSALADASAVNRFKANVDKLNYVVATDGNLITLEKKTK
jgi:anti-sigma B factor antagonist